MVWRSGRTLESINEVNLLRARLVLGWVWNLYLDMWPTTQVNSAWPSFCGWPRNEYQPKGGDVLIAVGE